MKKTRKQKKTQERQVPIFGGRKMGVLVTDPAGRQRVVPFGGALQLGEDGNWIPISPGPSSESVVAGVGSAYDFVTTDGDFVVSEDDL